MNKLNTWGESKGIDRRDSEESYRQLSDLSPDALLVCVDDLIVFVNASLLEMAVAVSFDQFIGRSIIELLCPDSNPVLKQHIAKMRQSGEMVMSLPLEFIRSDKSVIQVDAAAGLLMWNGANAVQLRFRRATNLTEHEIQLQESEARFHQLADAMPQMVWMARPDGVIDYHNRKWFEQTGLTEEAATVPDVWNLILHPDDAPEAKRNWERCVRDGERFQMEYRYKDPQSQTYRWHLGRALPVKDEHGEIIRWFGTCTDIHDQKIAEIALRQAKDQLANNALHLEKLVTERTTELEASARSSEALNYSIAHDLRAPLRAMVGFSNALLEEYGPNLDLTGQEYAGRIAASAKRMDNLIASLLAYGRLNYEELTFGFINTELLLETLLYEFDAEFKTAGARVTLIKPFPNVWANTTVLKKVLSELIENSLKFCQPGKPPEIEIWAEEKESKNVLWIRDNGIGIPPEHHERVFRVLESLHIGEKYPGTGIGLAIARRGVERLGGCIGIKPAPGQGSSFWIELPKALI